MMDTEFEKRIKELEAMVGSSMEMELFNTRYAVLLRDINKLNRPRYGLLLQLRKLGYLQTEYLSNELKENGKSEMKEIVQ